MDTVEIGTKNRCVIEAASVYEFYRLKESISLEQVNIIEWSTLK